MWFDLDSLRLRERIIADSQYLRTQQRQVVNFRCVDFKGSETDALLHHIRRLPLLHCCNAVSIGPGRHRRLFAYASFPGTIEIRPTTGPISDKHAPSPTKTSEYDDQ
jgi:hypothetical protein